VECFATSLDGKWLLAGGADGVIRAWNTVTRQMAWEQRAHQAPVRFIGALNLMGRVWPDGTPEPCDWQVRCVDSSPYPPGVVGLIANEDPPNGDGQWIDLDNASASGQLACVELCGNGIDDDQDGLIDCRDPDCGGDAACACAEPFADLDGDFDVDQSDFGLWQGCFTGGLGSPWTYDPAQCGCLDRDDVDGNGVFDRAVDGDGYIDHDDLALFDNCRRGPGIPAQSGCDG